MQTIRDACQLQPNALSIKLSDQGEQLDELITAEGDGAQFFEKTYITQGMRDVIARDLWDGNASAHAQVIDLKTGKEGAPLNWCRAEAEQAARNPSAHAVAGNAATQVGSLLLTASLSTAVNAVKGLTREEMVECLVSPLREPSEFLAAFEEL